MILARLCLFLAGFALLTSQSGGQDKGKPDDASPKTESTEKSETRNFLPTYWRQLGISDEQRQAVYKLNGKYSGEIEKLEDQIKALKAKLNKERLALLTPEQRKKLETIIREKAGTDK